MKLVDVFICMVYCEIERVFIDELEGCIIVMLVMFYLSGIFLFIFGECFNCVIVCYLKFVREFNLLYFGFEFEVYGFVLEEINGVKYYFVDCVKN